MAPFVSEDILADGSTKQGELQGLYAAQLAKWRAEADDANSAAFKKKRGPKPNLEAKTELLAVLGLTQSFSRPRVSDDNPFSEGQFKTLKYHCFFKPFNESIDDARKMMTEFFEWYNKEHRHINHQLDDARDSPPGKSRRCD
jgi:hypothetical protein